jgi:hypothetical protein
LAKSRKGERSWKWEKTNWLGEIEDEKNIGDINLPGTHDSAAFNAWTHTLYACHKTSITGQLEGGIRLLDVRIKVKDWRNSQSIETLRNSPASGFVTCHGAIGIWMGVNEYQSLESLFGEVRDFLSAHPQEAVVMKLQIDDWSSYQGQKSKVKQGIRNLITSCGLPCYNAGDTNGDNAPADLPVLGQLRGKVFLLSNDGHAPGAPVSWSMPDDINQMVECPAAGGRNFPVLVQDIYKKLPVTGSCDKKLELVTQAFGSKCAGDGRVLLNFASATWYGVMGVYIQKELFAYLYQNRPSSLGWLFLDYESEPCATVGGQEVSVVDAVIDSNFGYQKYGPGISSGNITLLAGKGAGGQG